MAVMIIILCVGAGACIELVRTYKEKRLSERVFWISSVCLSMTVMLLRSMHIPMPDLINIMTVGLRSIIG